MAHWFHRNPIKATGDINFNQFKAATDPPCTKLCSMTGSARSKLLDQLNDARHSDATVKTALEEYVKLLHGFLESPDPNKPGVSKLKHLVCSRWSSSLIGVSQVVERCDAHFEFLSMLCNVAIWYTKHAAYIAGSNENPTMEQAKEVHTALRLAAGFFKTIDSQLASIEDADNLAKQQGTDMDRHVIAAYTAQCQAEAQEVTIARAIEMKHQPAIVAALAFETSKLYENGEIDLRSVPDKQATKWRAYCGLKQQFYLAYAYCYNGEQLLAEDKAGLAMRGLQEAQKCYDKALELCKTYSSASGLAAHPIKPATHLFFRKLGPVIKRTTEKVAQQNSLIYHQKTAFDPPQLEIKEGTFGLVTPKEFDMPKPHELWTVINYDSFDHSKGPTTQQREKAAEHKVPEKVKQPKEVEHEQKGGDPTNSSGCVIS